MFGQANRVTTQLSNAQRAILGAHAAAIGAITADAAARLQGHHNAFDTAKGAINAFSKGVGGTILDQILNRIGGSEDGNSDSSISTGFHNPTQTEYDPSAYVRAIYDADGNIVSTTPCTQTNCDDVEDRNNVLDLPEREDENGLDMWGNGNPVDWP